MLDLTRSIDWFDRIFGSGGVVAYHGVTEAPFLPTVHVTAAALAVQLEYLAEAYHVIPLHELVARRQRGLSLDRCAAITFDDAYSGVLTFALPLLEQRRLPATVFVVPEYSESGRAYWWDRLEWARMKADPERRLRSLMSATGLPAPTSEQSYQAIAVGDAGRLGPEADTALTEVERAIGLPPIRPLTEAELQTLARSELVDFGCHTMSHRTLPSMPVHEKRHEIAASHRWIADRLPRARPFAAYPYGLYDRETMRAARDAGMIAGFTMRGHAVPPWFPLFACPRIGLTCAHTTRGLRLRMSRLTIPVVVWRNRGFPRAPATTVLRGRTDADAPAGS